MSPSAAPLRSVDVYVLLAAGLMDEALRGARSPSILVAERTGLSPRAARASLDRLAHLGALTSAGVVSRRALRDLLPALRFIAPAELDPHLRARGIPTAFAAPVFEGRIRHAVPYVWPSTRREGTVPGVPVPPLHEVVPEICRYDEDLYDALALVDALRVGRAREIDIAREELYERYGIEDAPPEARAWS